MRALHVETDGTGLSNAKDYMVTKRNSSDCTFSCLCIFFTSMYCFTLVSTLLAFFCYIKFCFIEFQETALNHVKSAGLLDDGFGSTPEMYKKNLIWVVTKMQVLVNRYPAW